MIIILTGLSGSGKTTILKEAKIENTFYADDYIKDVLYKKGEKLYDLIKENFGDEVVDNEKVDTSKLGKIVFNDPKKLTILNNLVSPFVRKWFKSIKGNAIIEMAAFINYKEVYEDLVDFVIMVIKENPIMDEKFNYMDSKKQPIFKKDINPDFIIEHNGTLKEASDKLISLYASICK